MSPEVVGLLASADRFLMWLMTIALWGAVGFVAGSLLHRLQADPRDWAVFWQALSLVVLLTLATLFTAGLEQRVTP